MKSLHQENHPICFILFDFMRKIDRLQSRSCKGIFIIMVFSMALNTSDANAAIAIEKVSTHMRGQSEVVQIELSQPLAANPPGFSVAQPARIAVDFFGVTNGVGRSAIEVGSGNLRSINVVQAGDRSRVVLNLVEITRYRTELQGQSIFFVLDPVLPKPEIGTHAQLAEKKRPNPNHEADSVEPITLNFANADIESVVRTMSVVTGRNVLLDPRVKGKIDLMTDQAVPPLAAFQQFASVLRMRGFATIQSEGIFKIVPEADAKVLAGDVRIGVDAWPKAAVDTQIVTRIFKISHQSASNLLPALRPLIAQNNVINFSPGTNSLVVTDYADNVQRIARIIEALDFPEASDVDIISLKNSIAVELLPLVQRLIEGSSRTTSFNSSLDGSDISFRTTLSADPRSNSLILRAANPARSSLVRSLVDKLDRPAAESSNGAAGNIYVVYLKNADAVRLAITLRAAMAANQINFTAGAAGGVAALQGQGAFAQQASFGSSQGSSSSQASAPLNNANQPATGGQIQADPSTNSLIISAPEPQYRQIRAVIDRLDGRRAQVMIETLIVEVNAAKAASFGVQWQSALGSNALAGTNSSLGGQNILALTQAIARKNVVGVQLGRGLNLGIAGKINGQYILGAIASFLSSDNDANVLSTPNLLTLDNEEARIVIGQNVPFPTGSYASTSGLVNVNPFKTVERKDVGLTLRVRPTINENGTVKMQIFQEISSVAAGTLADQNGPTTDKRSLESSVLVDDGGLVMLGGMLSDTYGTSIDKVPLAGDIPLLGNLFKTENRSRSKKNLMMFLHPVVMRDAASSESFAYGHYEQIRGLQRAVQPSTDNATLTNISAAPVLPVPTVGSQVLPEFGSSPTDDALLSNKQRLDLCRRLVEGVCMN